MTDGKLEGKPLRIGKILLRKEKLKYMKAEELRLFYHILRMTNSLRSIQKLHLKIGRGADHLENIKDTIDLHFNAIALYYEAIRTFLGSIEPRLNET
jgi:hypothetical protein